ncbi:MAG: M28 family peptidase [Bacteroidia bacterium]|nr:M28 family peptidase [Bacteroidia bacterium]
MKVISLLLLLLLNLSVGLFAQNQPPQILNLHASFSYTDNRMTLTYDLVDAEGDSVEIFFRRSDNAAETYLADVAGATGDIGFPVMPGTGKQIIWNAPQAISTVLAQVKLIADDRQPLDIQSIVDQVDSLRLKNDLGWLEGIRHPATGIAHLAEVKDSLEARFLAGGLTTYRQAQTLGVYSIENIIGLKPGHVDESQTWIVDGHFDGVHNSPAADDNGSAVAGMLEILREVAPWPFRNNVRFIGFDLEEAGTLGSQLYVNQGIKPWETIAGVINLEMIGYFDASPNTQIFPAGFNLLFPAAYNAVVADSSRGNFITNVAEPNSATLRDKFDDCAAKYVPDLRVISLTAPANPALVPDLLRSDHAHFWAAGIPALMITDGANFRNPHYHTPGDSVGTLHFTFMSQVVKAALGTLIELAGPIHGDVEVSEVGIMNTGLGNLSTICKIEVEQTGTGIRIEVGECGKNGITAKLMNIAGQAVAETRTIPGKSDVYFKTEGFSPGIYLLWLENQQGMYSTKIWVR